MLEPVGLDSQNIDRHGPRVVLSLEQGLTITLCECLFRDCLIGRPVVDTSVQSGWSVVRHGGRSRVPQRSVLPGLSDVVEGQCRCPARSSRWLLRTTQCTAFIHQVRTHSLLFSEHGWICAGTVWYGVPAVLVVTVTVRCAVNSICNNYRMATHQMCSPADKKLSCSLENRASALCFRLIIMLLSGIWLWAQLHVTCGIFSKPTWQRTHASLQESVDASSCENHTTYPNKPYTARTTLCLKNVPLCHCLLSSSNINRFSKFFHWHILYTICNNMVTKYPTTL